MAPATGDRSEQLLEQVRRALEKNTPLRIRGAGSKDFLGRPVAGEALDTRAHRGILRFEPTELVLTARAGTPLQELVAALDEQDQMLPFEPPLFDGRATLGGALATGLSGPRRPWVGALRDFVLGSRVITGFGQHLRFGGEVMKNVAGYDVSRLMAGSFGCLGLVTEVSLKVLPKPRQSRSLRLEMSAERALAQLAEWGREPLPISAACHDGQALHLRLEGGEGSVAAAAARFGGDALDDGYWDDLREQRLPFFAGPGPLWRLSLPPLVASLRLPGEQLLDWGGAQRWLKSDIDAASLRAAVSDAGGHAVCYRGAPPSGPFHPLSPGLLRYHRQLKAALDPQGIFNPGRMYAEF